MERMVRLPEVKSVSGLSRSTIYNFIRQGLFPHRILLGPRAVGWRESEIAAVTAARTRGANADEIRSLVAQLETARQSAA